MSFKTTLCKTFFETCIQLLAALGGGGLYVAAITPLGYSLPLRVRPTITLPLRVRLRVCSQFTAALVTYPICPLLLNRILYLGTFPMSTDTDYFHWLSCTNCSEAVWAIKAVNKPLLTITLPLRVRPTITLPLRVRPTITLPLCVNFSLLITCCIRRKEQFACMPQHRKVMWLWSKHCYKREHQLMPEPRSSYWMNILKRNSEMVAMLATSNDVISCDRGL